MLSFKKYMFLSLSLFTSVAVLIGCGSKKEQTKASYTPKELKIQYVPLQTGETLAAKTKSLEKLLSDKLGIPVKLSVSDNYNTIIEEMSSKKVDVSILPPTAYVLVHNKKAADVLLQAQHYAVKEDGSNTDQLVDYYKGIIVVKKNSPISSLLDLKDKKIAWQDVASATGYIYPAVEMKKAGIDPKKDVKGITVKGNDKGVIAVLNGDVDAAAVFEDARNNVKKDFPNIFNDTKVIYRTEGIPNDTITVRSDMDEKWKDKISQAFIDIAKDPEGLKLVKDLYAHSGYVKSNDTNFDTVREYQKALSSENK